MLKTKLRDRNEDLVVREITIFLNFHFQNVSLFNICIILMCAILI